MPAVDEKAEHLCGESRAAQHGILYSLAKFFFCMGLRGNGLRYSSEQLLRTSVFTYVSRSKLQSTRQIPHRRQDINKQTALVFQTMPLAPRFIYN